jgi:hypothetical protein
MKIQDRVKGTIFFCKAEFRNGNYYHLGICPEHTRAYGVDEKDIVDLKCEIIDDDVEVNNLYKDKKYDPKSVDYFGFIKYDEEDKYWDISMIYPCLTLYHMCFPYGADAERFYNNDIKDIFTYKITHHKGDRRAYNVRLKVEQV